MKNSFFSRFTPKEPKFFPLLKQVSEVLYEASAVLTESLQYDSPTERADYLLKINLIYLSSTYVHVSQI